MLYALHFIISREIASGYLPAEISTDMASQGFNHELNSEAEAVPNEADILVSYATVAGYVAYRHNIHGSFYIQALCDCISHYSDK